VDGVRDEEAASEHQGTNLKHERKRRPLEDGGMEGAENVGKVDEEETR
jgi:hypothetical protein